MSTPITSDKLLLVEGKDEVNFFTALLKFLGIEHIDIRTAGGCRNFANLYPSIIVTSGFNTITRLGFIRDAEQTPAASAFTSICNIIKRSTPHIKLPDAPGKIKTDNVFSCGIFIMPNNKDAGMIENLCLQSVSSDVLYSHTEEYVTKVIGLKDSNEVQKYNQHKAKTQAYLAGKTDIPRNLGEAALQGIWDFSNATFAPIKKFILDLFS